MNFDGIQFDSNYAVDKIVFMQAGSVNAANLSILSGSIYQYVIPHSFTRPVFTELQWSFDGSTYIDGGGSLDVNNNTSIAYSDSKNLYIITQNIVSGTTTGTLFYRLVGSWIDNYDTTNPAITPAINTTGKLFFDSRSNYEKIYKQDVVSLAPSTGSFTDIGHNLGYVPNYKVYFESLPGQVWPMIAGGTQNLWLYNVAQQYELYSEINSTVLQLNWDTSFSNTATARAWYRIYV